LPWIDLQDSEWATLPVDRAEIATPGGKRPEDAFVMAQDDIYTCWPTKLAFAPRVAELVTSWLLEQGTAPSAGDVSLSALGRPPLAQLPWDEVRQWS